LTASSPRKTVAKMIRKMQVPAYPCGLVGVHRVVYRDVVVLVKKVIDIIDIDIEVVVVDVPVVISISISILTCL
jgi:hypothetical protein